MDLTDKKTDTVDVVLARDAVYFWNINDVMHLVLYEELKYPEDEDVMGSEGGLEALQRFKIKVLPKGNTTARFKLSNIDDSGTSFNDKKEDYLLEIKISR